MAVGQVLVLLASVFIVTGQRPSFAGTRPIGFPELLNKTTTTPSGLEDKFGEVTTQRLPIEAQGDRELVDRLSKLPIDNQPFWFINWQALEAERLKPQTYPQRPNSFLEFNFQNTVPQPQNTNSGSNFATNFYPVSTPVSTVPQNNGNVNSGSVQIPKTQDPVNTKEQDLTNKNGNPNDKVPDPVPTSTSIKTNCNTGINKPPPKTNIHSGTKATEENEFEDMEVRKLRTNLLITL